jgi:signal transduction histidine kinase
MELPLILLTLVVIANFSLGSIVLLRTRKLLYGWFFAATVFSVALWDVGDIMLLAIKNHHLLRLAETIFYIAPLYIPLFILFFSISFASEKRYISKKLVVYLSLIPLIMTLIIALKPTLLISSVSIYSNMLNVPHVNLPNFYLYMLYFSVYFISSYVVLFSKLRSSKGVKKIQLMYTLYGVLIASVPALVTNLTLPTLGIGSAIWLGPIFTLIFISSVTAAIVRYRLFDIRLAIIRSSVYIASVAVLALGFNYVIFGLLKHILNFKISSSDEIIVSVAAALAALIFQNIKSFFNRLTSRLFYQDSYDAQELFDNLNRILISTLDLDRLLKQSSTLIAASLKAEYCAIGVRGEANKLSIVGSEKLIYTNEEINTIRGYLVRVSGTSIITDDLDDSNPLKALLVSKNIGFLVPLGQESRKYERSLGYIIVGTKKSGNPYSIQDYRVLETISKELILAIQNAVRFEQIEHFNITLQEKIDNATKSLRRNNEKLKALDETKDDFISMASHQLRTPLTSIKGYLSMLNEGDAGKLTKVQKDMIGQAFTSSQRMVYLISDMLNVSRLKTGKFAVEVSKFNLADLVHEEVDQLIDTANSKGLSLTYTKPDSFPDYMLDETKTRQVIMNFIDNAIYYTPTGGNIQVKLEDKPSYIELKVIDDGIGVPASEKHHLFNKFFRAHNARKARPDGTGLGLYMAKKIVIAQGGTVVFDTKEDKGSTFGFIFPKSKVKLPDETTPQEAETK